MNTSRTPRVAVTGASGYLGGVIVKRLLAEGAEVLSFGRREPSDSRQRWTRFQLGERISSKDLRGVDALVHCAWDFRQRSWTDISAINVLGTQRLFEAASTASVDRIIHISTVSASGDPRSMYGRAKLITEENAIEHGGTIIRPGLLYGPDPGGMVGMLMSLVRVSPVVPVIVGHESPLSLAHENDLATLVSSVIKGEEPRSKIPLVAAAPKPHTLREILSGIAGALRRRRLFVRAPWQMAYYPLRIAEIAHLPAPLRADSALSIATLEPDPFRDGLAPTSTVFRDFDPHDLLLSDPARGMNSS